jgi:hypothetical protein
MVGKEKKKKKKKLMAFFFVLYFIHFRSFLLDIFDSFVDIEFRIQLPFHPIHHCNVSLPTAQQQMSSISSVIQFIWTEFVKIQCEELNDDKDVVNIHHSLLPLPPLPHRCLFLFKLTLCDDCSSTCFTISA